jgi:hypothetical protein
MSESFFPASEPSPLAEDDEDQSAEFESGWEGPPRHLRPGLSDVSVVLGRSASTVAALQAAWCYPTGVVLELAIHLKDTCRGARRRVLSTSTEHKDAASSTLRGNPAGCAGASRPRTGSG